MQLAHCLLLAGAVSTLAALGGAIIGYRLATLADSIDSAAD